MGEGSLARLFLLSDSHITKDIYRNNMISSNFSLNNTQTKRTFNQFKNFNMFKLTYGWDTLQTCMKHRGDPQLVVVKTAFPEAPWKGYATITENLVILFHLMMRYAFPPSGVFQSSQCLRDLRNFHVLGKEFLQCWQWWSAMNGPVCPVISLPCYQQVTGWLHHH